MNRIALLAGTAALLLTATPGFAQNHPNFAGSWTLIADANAPTPGGRGGGFGGGMMGGGLGQTATITQDAANVVITRATPMGEIKTTYKLDGSPSNNTLTMQDFSLDQVSKARWDADKLVVTTTISAQGMNFETTTAFSLDGSGHLVVETASPGRGGGAGMTTTTRYQKGT
jgi:hypothetical protein